MCSWFTTHRAAGLVWVKWCQVTQVTTCNSIQGQGKLKTPVKTYENIMVMDLPWNISQDGCRVLVSSLCLVQLWPHWASRWVAKSKDRLHSDIQWELSIALAPMDWGTSLLILLQPCRICEGGGFQGFLSQQKSGQEKLSPSQARAAKHAGTKESQGRVSEGLKHTK